MDLPEYSYWIIAGLAFVIAEFAVSGLVVIFFGIAALLVGSLKFLGLLDDTAWELTLFALTSLLLLVFVRRVINDKLMGNERPRQTVPAWSVAAPPWQTPSATAWARASPVAPRSITRSVRRGSAWRRIIADKPNAPPSWDGNIKPPRVCH